MLGPAKAIASEGLSYDGNNRGDANTRMRGWGVVAGQPTENDLGGRFSPKEVLCALLVRVSNGHKVLIEAWDFELNETKSKRSRR